MHKIANIWAWIGERAWVKIPIVLLILITAPIWGVLLLIGEGVILLIVEFCTLIAEMYQGIVKFLWPER